MPDNLQRVRSELRRIKWLGRRIEQLQLHLQKLDYLTTREEWDKTAKKIGECQSELHARAWWGKALSPTTALVFLQILQSDGLRFTEIQRLLCEAYGHDFDAREQQQKRGEYDYQSRTYAKEGPLRMRRVNRGKFCGTIQGWTYHQGWLEKRRGKYFMNLKLASKEKWLERIYESLVNHPQYFSTVMMLKIHEAI